MRIQIQKLCELLRKEYNFRHVGRPRPNVPNGGDDDADQLQWNKFKNILELGDPKRILELCQNISNGHKHASPCTY